MEIKIFKSKEELDSLVGEIVPKLSTSTRKIAKTTIMKLDSDKYLSDSLELTMTPGIHVIRAGTGCGKTELATMFARKNNGCIVEPLVQLYNQQVQRDLARIEKPDAEQILTKFIKFEEFAEKLDIEEIANTYDCVFIDEAQIVYDSTNYRYKAVGTNCEKIEKLSKIIPVFFISATIRINRVPFNITSLTIADKGIRKDYELVVIDSASSQQCIFTYTKALAKITADAVFAEKNKRTPTMLFVNSGSSCENIQRKLAELNINMEIVSSSVNSKDKNMDLSKVEDKDLTDWQYVIKYERTDAFTDENGVQHAGIKGDGFISTSAAEPGININSYVTIISEQACADNVIQRWGRGRGECRRILVTGNGGEFNKEINGYRSFFNSILKSGLYITDDNLRKQSIIHERYADNARKTAYAASSIADLQKEGYDYGKPKFIEENDIENSRNNITKKELEHWICQNVFLIASKYDETTKGLKGDVEQAKLNPRYKRSKLFDVDTNKKVELTPKELGSMAHTYARSFESCSKLYDKFDCLQNFVLNNDFIRITPMRMFNIVNDESLRFMQALMTPVSTRGVKEERTIMKLEAEEQLRIETLKELTDLFFESKTDIAELSKEAKDKSNRKRALSKALNATKKEKTDEYDLSRAVFEGLPVTQTVIDEIISEHQEAKENYELFIVSIFQGCFEGRFISDYTFYKLTKLAEIWCGAEYINEELVFVEEKKKPVALTAAQRSALKNRRKVLSEMYKKHPELEHITKEEILAIPPESMRAITKANKRKQPIPEDILNEIKF